MKPIMQAALEQAEDDIDALRAQNAALLAALREFIDLCPRMSDDDPIAPALADACNKARAAIAAAEQSTDKD